MSLDEIFELDNYICSCFFFCWNNYICLLFDKDFFWKMILIKIIYVYFMRYFYH